MISEKPCKAKKYLKLKLSYIGSFAEDEKLKLNSNTNSWLNLKEFEIS